MVVLTEEFHGLTLKRKGADEPGLFDAAAGDDNRSGFPLSCRANKMRRLAGPDPDGEGAPAWGATAAGQDDVMPMCDDGPAPAGDDEEGALVLYGGGGRSEAPRLAVRDGAEWVRAMLREADSRTVRELLAGAGLEHRSEELGLALVPWVPPSAAAAEEEEAEPSTAAETAGDEDEGAAAMDVEDEAPVRQWTGQAVYGGNGGAEGLVYRWSQHCMTPLQMPPAPQPSPVMWSW